MFNYLNKSLNVIARFGLIPIKWIGSLLSAFESNPKTSRWIFFIIISIITGKEGLPFLAAIYEALKSFIRK